MHKHFHLQYTWYFYIILLSVFLWLGTTRWVCASLRIEPTAPIVAVGESIPLTAAGATGKVQWFLSKPESGEIQVISNSHATYVAPNKVGQYYIQVLANNGSNKPISKVIQVTVLQKEAARHAFSREKSVWEVFTNRGDISTLLFSDNKEIFWVGTHGGLEMRDSITRRLIQVFTNLDGLPENLITALENDGEGGLWIGTAGGLAHKNNQNEFKVFNTENSILPGNDITTLLNDGSGGVWIASGKPFSEAKISEKFGSVTNQLTEEKSSPLEPSINSDNFLNGLISDSSQDLFNNLLASLFGSPNLGEMDFNKILLQQMVLALDCIKGNSFLETMGDFTDQGYFAHLSGDEQWTLFQPENLITNMISDGKKGLWVGTYCGGLAHLSHEGNWTFNSDLPKARFITALYQDDNEGLWVGTAFNGLAYRNNLNEWQFYNTNSGLPNNYVTYLTGDGNDAVIVSTRDFFEEKSGHVIRINSNDKITPIDSEPSDEELEQLDLTNTGLPNNLTNHTIMSDGDGGVWVGTSNMTLGIDLSALGILGQASHGGLAHLDKANKWTIYNVDAGLPNNNIGAVAIDDNNALWVGTLGGGLAHLKNANEWITYNTGNSGLPHDNVLALLSDKSEGLWIGTAKGLAHRNSEGEWAVFNPNSSYQDNSVGVLMNDGNGGLWMGTGYGLAHRSPDDEWTIYNTSNSSLPHNLVADLLSDDNGGLWIATGSESEGGLVHLSVLGDWTIYNPDNSELPSHAIRAIASDGSGGIWIGTLNGLVHRSFRDEWTIFNTTNSGLPQQKVLGLASDGSNGLWVSGWGLAHLTFSQKSILCEKVPNITDEQCEKLLKGHRAAILVHPNGRGIGYHPGIAVDNMATYVYQTLFLRGYDHDEVYYIAYKPNLDFNGDGTPDYEIVDAPVTLKDFASDEKKPREPLTIKHLETAFDWAKKRHNEKASDIPEEPLVVIFIDHGLPDELVLEPSTHHTLNERKFKALLDDYQAATGNKVVVILEACYSGTLIESLQAPNRLIITSTDDKLAYYKDLGRTSFTRFYFDELHQGTAYWNSLQFVKGDVFAQLGIPFNEQNSQLEDSADTQTAKSLCLNDCYGSLPAPKLIPETLLRFISSTTIELAVKIDDFDNDILNVSVSVITPNKANEYNENGFELHQSPVKTLNKGDNGRWFTHFEELTELGEYKFLFQVEYKIRSGSRTVSALKPVTVDFQACQTHAHYNPVTSTLHLPAVKMPNEHDEEVLYQADYVLTSVEPIILELQTDSMAPINNTGSACMAQFKPVTNMLYIPAVDIPNEKGDMDTFSAELERVPNTSPWQFRLMSQ
jgi:ligand-binding sensor domain-containing protein